METLMPAPGPDPASSALHLANTTDSDYPRQLRVHDLLARIIREGEEI